MIKSKLVCKHCGNTEEIYTKERCKGNCDCHFRTDGKKWNMGFVMNQTITMFCIFDKTQEKYKIYNPYYNVWHEPFWLDTYVESSSLMKSDLEALNILKRLYNDESTNYKKKIKNKEIVIKKVILQVIKNIEEYETYEITKQKGILKLDDKVNLLEFSGNALNHICKDNPEYYELNWNLYFNIDEVLK